MTEFIVIVLDQHEWTLPCDTVEELDLAAKALADYGIAEARIYVGSPDSPDSYASARMLRAAPPSVPEGEAAR